MSSKAGPDCGGGGGGCEGWRSVLVGIIGVAVICASCSSGTSAGSGGSGPDGQSSRSAPGTASGNSWTRQVRPSGPAANVSEELTAGNGPFMGAATGAEVPAGFVQNEYVASGTATDFKASGPLSKDGRWSFQPDTTAAYRTRIVVRRPSEAAKASGTVIIEWLNVSGGVDANPDYASLFEEITRKGHVWIGVSAQLIGVAGGPVLVRPPGTESIVGKGLKVLDPARYGTLDHPGDGYSYDIFTQVARAAFEGGPLVGGVEPQVVLAAGESQSAIALTTYYNGVQPITKAFDGFLVHSRASVPLPLVEPGKYADLTGSITSGAEPALLRGDLDAPVLELQAESDVVGVLSSIVVRQPDSDRFRLWEVAGTAHADAHLLGVIASSLDCGVPINDAPMHIVAKAALRALDNWARTGQAPPGVPVLETTSGDKPEISRNADGIALGGIRTAPVEVPVEIHSGVAGPSPELMCVLLGSTKPMPAARIAELYQSRGAYEQKYGAEVDRSIQGGLVLPEDRDALLAYSDPSRVSA